MRYLRSTRTTLFVIPALLVVIIGVAFGTASAAKVQPAKAKPSKTYGAVVAYGLVEPLCATCDRPKGFDPLVSAESAGVTLASQPTTYEKGTWCFKLSSTARRQVVIVSPEGGASAEPPGSVPTSVGSAQWVARAPDCGSKDIEIKTLRYYNSPTSSALSAAPNGDVPFSFAVIR
jgi:hypothetical protein